ncbi:D-alanine--D-alanine ligase family protein [Butyrivibrio sp. MC2013]|uniref:D-alanine--D-alanine ligase family protein n=1 Tax=Butyrivibrio sp. MC2013 TaxID=1280686 RepID=UPI000420C80F|nr:D-alanine--D-alanine ligase [Butyrivibrio sp. MC2013]
MKIVVLCGGLSTERNISIISGTKVCKALRAKGHKAVLVDLFMGLEDYPSDIIESPEKLFDKLPELKAVSFDGEEPDLGAIVASRKYKSPSVFGKGVLKLCRRADVVFMALHGMNGEDGRIQATFDLMGIRYTGSGHLGSAMGMDKIITKQIVRYKGVRTPDFNFYDNVKETDIAGIVKENKIPCVVKTPTGGSSVGVYIVRDEKDFAPAIKRALKYSSDILVEQFIGGREFTNAVLMGRALPSVEIIPVEGGYDYKNKYSAGAAKEICPGRLNEEQVLEMGKMALIVHNTLGLKTYSRSDFILSDDGLIYFLEVNTLPGMTPTSLVPQEAEAVGISYEELCDIIVQDACLGPVGVLG